jgi:hypothetical protein
LQSSRNLPNPDSVRGWILDVYPSALGEFAVWIIAENGERVRLKDSFNPKIYISGKGDSLERLAAQLLDDLGVVSWDFVQRYAKATDSAPSQVLEVILEDCRRSPAFTLGVLKSGRYLQYNVFNCDLKPEQLYFYEHDVFPLGWLTSSLRMRG